MPAPQRASARIVSVCRRLYERGYVVATEGNVSVRMPSGSVLITGTRVEKRIARASDLVRLSPAGEKLSGTRPPSSESMLHLTVYAKRPDVRAIVHAHPPYCTAFAVARRPLPVDAIPEVIVELGRVPLVPFAVPSTGRLSAVIAPMVGRGDFFLLANHGVLSCGRDLDEAFERIERAEHAAKTVLLARLLGGERRLAGKDVETLRTIARRRSGRRKS